MQLANKIVLITGANRGIGLALANEALKRGAKRVYAGTRSGALPINNERVTPVTLDVTDTAQIKRAAGEIDALDLLINNAGISLFEDLKNEALIEQTLAINLMGPLRMSLAFQPRLIRSKGSILNILSLAAIAPVPFSPAYSISKAAALNMTQSLRMLLAGQGVSVHAAILGPVDTDMVRSLEVPKTAPEVVAKGIVDGLEKGEEEIFPDPFAQTAAEAWRNGISKALERQFAAFMPPAVLK